PKPQSKMTWDNAAWVSPRTAESAGVGPGDMVEISMDNRKLHAPVWVMPGHADNSVTLHLGYGRSQAGNVANGIGFDAYALRGADAPWCANGSWNRISGHYDFATTQHTQTMEERSPFRLATFGEYRVDPAFARPADKRVTDSETLFPLWPYPDYKWGM